jgi:hypothetical protein
MVHTPFVVQKSVSKWMQIMYKKRQQLDHYNMNISCGWDLYVEMN